MTTGKLIVIDGIDGSGKGTQTRMLQEHLTKEGYDVVSVDFPQYGSKSAGPIEEYLNGKYGKLDPYRASILYAVDRHDASYKLREWLDAGKIIISNRYVTANAGHQGGNISDPGERDKYFTWLNNLEYEIFGIPKPDLNIIIHVPAETAQKLVDKKNSEQRVYNEGKKRDILEADIEHLKHAEKIFLEIAEKFPNMVLLESVDENGKMLSPESVHNKLWDIVLKEIK